MDKFLDQPPKPPEPTGRLFPAGASPPLFGVVECVPATLAVKTPEGSALEYKVDYDPQKIPFYLKTLVSMANAGETAGMIVFGISDKPARIRGISGDHPSEEQWTRIIPMHFEPFKIGFLSEVAGGLDLAAARIESVPQVPVICRTRRKDPASPKGGPDLEDGAVYYRYGSNTQMARHGELRMLIDSKRAAMDERRDPTRGAHRG